VVPNPEDHRQTPYGPEPSQFVEWVGVSEPRRRILLVALHGGFWRAAYGLDHLRPFCAALAARGFPVASLEYRRLGEPGGGWPGTLDDVRAGCASLAAGVRRHHLELSGVLLAGHSAGGHLALWAAARVPSLGGLPCVGVVGLAPVTDLVEASRLHLSKGAVHEFLQGTPEQVPARYQEASPAALVPLGVPTTLVHGTDDEDVPYAMSTAYVKRARAAGDDVRLVTLEGGGHFDVIEPGSAYWPQVTEVLESLH
jgi:acetyl esterase/lipase